MFTAGHVFVVAATNPLAAQAHSADSVLHTAQESAILQHWAGSVDCVVLLALHSLALESFGRTAQQIKVFLCLAGIDIDGEVLQWGLQHNVDNFHNRLCLLQANVRAQQALLASFG